MKNSLLLIVLLMIHGCASHDANVDAIYEARQKDSRTNSAYLAVNSSYCIDISSAVLNGYKEYFAHELSKEWSGVAKYEQSCSRSDYLVFINIIHLDYNQSQNKKQNSGHARRVKVQILNKSKNIVIDYSIGRTRYLHVNGYEYEQNRLFYANFISKYLNKNRIFGVK